MLGVRFKIGLSLITAVTNELRSLEFLRILQHVQVGPLAKPEPFFPKVEEAASSSYGLALCDFSHQSLQFLSTR
ncbi:hypothetical protein VTO42DRAFT_4190 [Malbranchea cinnamomea]